MTPIPLNHSPTLREENTAAGTVPDSYRIPFLKHRKDMYSILIVQQYHNLLTSKTSVDNSPKLSHFVIIAV